MCVMEDLSPTVDNNRSINEWKTHKMNILAPFIHFEKLYRGI